MPCKVIVVGAGAAGMMAAGYAGYYGCDVLLIEKNARPGRKILITGKGRCNVTNNCDNDTFLANVPTNSRFLYSAINSFNTQDTMSFFESRGLLKTVDGTGTIEAVSRKIDTVLGLEE